MINCKKHLIQWVYNYWLLLVELVTFTITMYSVLSQIKLHISLTIYHLQPKCFTPPFEEKGDR